MLDSSYTFSHHFCKDASAGGAFLLLLTKVVFLEIFVPSKTISHNCETTKIWQKVTLCFVAFFSLAYHH